MKKTNSLSSLSASHRAELAAEIRRRRARAKITWQALADACGVTLSASQQWGSGANTPGPRHLAALDKILK